MLDGHYIADVTEDNAGQLQLVVLHVGSGLKSQHHPVGGASHDNQGVYNAAAYHEFLVFIQDQKTCHRQNISEGNG